jgi:(2Fe-2S) ferredoxin
MTPSFKPKQQVLVCQNRTCRSQGSAAVLATFQAQELPGWQIIGCGCLGQCGKGPMVLVLPELVWYNYVQPGQVPVITDQHLRSGQPVQALLDPKLNRRSP